jgi:hypothetical protein
MANSIPNATEVLRVWSAPSCNQQFVLRTSWEDPGAWGLLLVDIARHAAQAYAREGQDPGQVLDRIRALFDAEWNSPTSPAEDMTDKV